MDSDGCAVMQSAWLMNEESWLDFHPSWGPMMIEMAGTHSTRCKAFPQLYSVAWLCLHDDAMHRIDEALDTQMMEHLDDDDDAIN